MKTAKRALGLLLAVFAFLGLGLAAAHAQTDQFGLSYGTYTGLTQADIRVTIANIIRVALGVLGIIAVIIVLYAGFLWMTAAGNEEQIVKAKQTLTAGVIGLLIIVSAFAIVSFIISRLLEATQGGGAVSSSVSDSACIGLTATCPAGALGNGIIESHYPPRNATGIPRNTRIVVTFKEKIKPESMTIGSAASTIAILKSNQIASNKLQFDQKFAASLTASDILIADSGDHKTFVFVQKNCSGATPDGCIGSPSENTFYTVALRGGVGGIMKLDGTPAFTGTFNAGYLWEFQVSTVLDLTPPKISSVEPVPDSTGNPRNTLIQMNFNKPIDPLSIQQGITITQGKGTLVAGTNVIGNGYTSVEFRSNDPCGVNSCGETIYCLPPNAHITASIAACGLSANPPTGVFPPNGITDMAGNSLDGNGDGKSEGPPTDNYVFHFDTNDTIDLVPPAVVSENPNAAPQITGSVARDMQITATFSKLMSTTSLRTDTIRLVPGVGGAPTNYYVISQPMASVNGGKNDETQAMIQHDLLSTNQPYASDLTSGLRDLHQNCFFPAKGVSVCTGGNPYCCNGLQTDQQGSPLTAPSFQTKCAIPAQ